MPFRSSVSIVASPRARVGKTLLARLLTDFYRQEGRSVAAYDLNSGDATLTRFLPEQTTVSEIASVKGQMALLDTLVTDDGVSRIVDLGHESFEAFFALARHIGFVEEAQRRSIAPAILFVVTPDATAVEAFRGLRRRFPQAQFCPVHNEIFGPARHSAKYALNEATVVRLPTLAPPLRKHVETPPFSFADEKRMAALPQDVQDELQHWLRRAQREFRELDLRTLLADLQSSIRLES